MSSELDRGKGEPDQNAERGITRRQFVVGAAAVGGMLSLGSLATACGGSTPATTSSSPAASQPKRGGNLRVAMTGGSPTDTLDASGETDLVDSTRLVALYNGLVTIAPDATIVNDLAEEFTLSKDARTCTIRLRPDVTFHNGKTLTADDVVFTFRRNMDPKNPMTGSISLALVDPKGLKALDSRTVEVKFIKPNSQFPMQLAPWFNLGVVPVGYDPKHPVGTGPFKFRSFTPGQQSVYDRNENYYKSGLPYLDQFTFIDSYGSDAAAENAFLGGEVDAYIQAPLTLAKQLASNPSAKQLISGSGNAVLLTMRLDQAPFNDVRVRQAFRLLVDRPQVCAVAFNGLAEPGSDFFSPQDPMSDRSLVRHQDLEQAKSLLKQAGQEHLTITLNTAPFAAGAIETAQVFAQQAQAAGVTVKINNMPAGTFFGPNYLKWTFGMDIWGYLPYLTQVLMGQTPGGPFNETHFNNPRFNSLFDQANASADPARVQDLVHEMQTIDFNEGGYIMPTFSRLFDLLSPRVKGLAPGAIGCLPMSNGDYEHVWLD
jgi:peptide/nickel transport system substrate-binding protein